MKDFFRTLAACALLLAGRLPASAQAPAVRVAVDVLPGREDGSWSAHPAIQDALRNKLPGILKGRFPGLTVVSYNDGRLQADNRQISGAGYDQTVPGAVGTGNLWGQNLTVRVDPVRTVNRTRQSGGGDFAGHGVRYDRDRVYVRTVLNWTVLGNNRGTVLGGGQAAAEDWADMGGAVDLRRRGGSFRQRNDSDPEAARQALAERVDRQACERAVAQLAPLLEGAATQAETAPTAYRWQPALDPGQAYQACDLAIAPDRSIVLSGGHSRLEGLRAKLRASRSRMLQITLWIRRDGSREFPVTGLVTFQPDAASAYPRMVFRILGSSNPLNRATDAPDVARFLSGG